MPTYRIDAVLGYRSGIPRDVSINTYHFNVTLTDPGEITDALNGTVEALLDFYNTPVGAGNSVGNYISDYVDRAGDACRFEVYDATGGPLLANQSWGIDAALEQTSLPLEVALCNSVYTNQNNGVYPLASRRGRNYIGPLNTEAINYANDLPPYPDPGFEEALRDGSERLEATVDGLGGINWCIWSRKLQLVTGNVSGGWIDNEFDTQRRRQVEATTRKTWVAP